MNMSDYSGSAIRGGAGFPVQYNDPTRPATVAVAMDPLFSPAAWKALAESVFVKLDEGIAEIPAALELDDDPIGQLILFHDMEAVV